MGHLGELLHQRQESLGLTLTDLQDRTKIREKYIKAILQGNYDLIPGEVYLRGFIRSIASELGIDPGEAMQAFYLDQGRASSEPPETSSTLAAPTQGEPATYAQEPVRSDTRVQKQARPVVPVNRTAAKPASLRKQRRQKSSTPVLVLISLLVLLGAGAWYWATYLRTPVEQPPVDPPIVDQNPPPEVEPPEPPEPTVSVTLTNPGEENLSYLVKPGPLTVTLTTTELGRCWVGVVTDEGTANATNRQYTLGYRSADYGQSLTVEADQQIKIRVGYPLVLNVEINGEDQGLLSGKDPRDLIISVDTTP